MNRSFGFHINAMRSARKTSILTLSQSTGISEDDLKRVENGTRPASKDQVLRLASHFGASEVEFLRLNHATRMTLETAGRTTSGRSSKTRHSILPKNSPLCRKRIENMKRELALLETRPFTVKWHEPVPALRPFIDSIVYCKGHDLVYSFERTVPDGTSQLQIVLGEGGRDIIDHSGVVTQRLTKAWVMGMNSIPVTYRLSEVEGILYVRFKPAGLYAFTKIHQAELNNLVVDARIIFGTCFDNLWETLAGCDQHQQMISHVEKFFLRKLDPLNVEPARLTYMLDHIHVPSTRLSKITGYSSKYLTQTFQKHIGVGPKTFQRIQRFHQSVCNLNHLTANIDWAEMVFQHGYHDQAHFIKDFKYFSGLTPQNYLALGPTCTRYLHATHPPEQLF